jgi:hypothetical protein
VRRPQQSRTDPYWLLLERFHVVSHYQTLKDTEILRKKSGVTTPGVLGKYGM